MIRRHRLRTIGVLLLPILALIISLKVWQGGRLRVFGSVSAQGGPVADFQPGDHFTPIDGVDLSAAFRTIVVFVNPACQYCVDSMSFYRILSAKAASAPRDLQFVVVGIEPKPVLEQFLSRHNIAPGHIAVVKRDEVNVRVTPTIVLVDMTGTINRVWTGEQSQVAQTLILELIRRASL